MSVIMRSQRAFSEENGRIQCRNIRMCNCCPYGYHIDLDFVRYCETLANAKPSEEQLLRRSRRRSRKSMEFMLGLENLFDHWEPAAPVQSVPEVPIEIEPDSPRVPPPGGWPSPSMHRFTYDGFIRGDSPLTSSSTSSGNDTTDTVPLRTTRPPTNSPPETSAFLHDALDEVCSDFERTLERASTKEKNNGSETSKESIDSCVAGNKPRPSKKQQQQQQAQYEAYSQAASITSVSVKPVERIPPPPPPRRHANIHDVSRGMPMASKGSETVALLASERTSDPETPSEAYTLYSIRQQMALSLKRMKDLEEQVKSIPELENELSLLRSDKRQLQQSLQRKDEEMQRVREYSRLSASPSPCSSKQTSPVQFTPQRISPIALESLGGRFRTNSSSSDQQQKSASPMMVMKRDVSTMCGLHSTRDVAVGSPVIANRTVGTNPSNTSNISESLYTKVEFDELVQLKIKAFEEKRSVMQLQKLISVGTQIGPVAKMEMRDSSMQTPVEHPVQKFSVGVNATAVHCDACITCMPETRTVGSSEDKTTDRICDRCTVPRRTVASGPDDSVEEKRTSVSLKLLDMPGRSATFSLGDNEKLNLKRKTIGTQYTPVVVQNIGMQTTAAQVTSVAVQSAPQQRTESSQCSVECCTRQTDTRDLLLLRATQISTDEIPPEPKKPESSGPLVSKVRTCETSCNTDRLRMTDHGVNTTPSAATRNIASNTEKVHKRDIACGDIVKPHISIACADNYCDSCKDAIKHLAKDFSKVVASPVLSRDSKIPRPTHITSPSPARKKFMRQNTYTITPSPTPSPIAEKKTLLSSLNERSATAVSLDSKSISPSYISDRQHASDASAIFKKDDSPSIHHTSRAAQLESVFRSETPATYELSHECGLDDIIIKEETRVRISWSKDGSPSLQQKPDAASQLKEEVSPKSSHTELAEKEEDDSDEEETIGASAAAAAGVSEARTSSLQDHAEPSASKLLSNQRVPAAILNQIASRETVPREKTLPSKEMTAALKVINDSLQKFASKSSSLKSATVIVQKEWFHISSTDKANPLDVEDYLDCYEDYSNLLLKYMVNLIDNNGNTAMHYAVSHGNFDVVSILLDSKVCNVNQMNNAGYTCVMLVSLAKLKNSAHRTVVQRLFQMADVNIRAKKHCQTALMLAVSHGNLDMVEMLLAAGADINIRDEDGSTALMCAAEHGRVDIVKHLLSQSDCDSLIQDVDGSTAFKIAWQAGHRDIGLLLYVHEQMLRSKMPSKPEQRTSSLSPRHHKRQPSQ